MSPLRFSILAAVSTKIQAAEDKDSLPNQVDRSLKTILQHNAKYPPVGHPADMVRFGTKRLGFWLPSFNPILFS
ncbi:MAG: hypothetical protein A2X25_14675 [Chloroflexi bacterium GWB2_49_20]|nr:MAG: hypothetical protein A2X25_14675 [Chloroflexi bacterium GWB2_49_20]OGN77247.1 MAG: hypothetical protein A2X26_08570 [Chloroflexi bacterium GWC2_49_37]OGN84756.1 MAG: hypothetical protein A2X27_15535 [Chloroflexi bacterium GWD2_49_16]